MSLRNTFKLEQSVALPFRLPEVYMKTVKTVPLIVHYILGRCRQILLSDPSFQNMKKPRRGSIISLRKGWGTVREEFLYYLAFSVYKVVRVHITQKFVWQYIDFQSLFWNFSKKLDYVIHRCSHFFNRVFSTSQSKRKWYIQQIFKYNWSFNACLIWGKVVFMKSTFKYMKK